MDKKLVQLKNPCEIFMKIPNKRELQQIAINNLPDFKYITKIF